MSYGLYDGDLKLYPRVPFFNLELMKLSTYYQKKRELVTLSPDFTPNMYTHFLVRQDYPSRSPYSTIYSNIEYGGRAFDGDKYKPLPNNIDFLQPNTHLYDKIESKVVNTLEDKKQFSVMRRAEHVRLSLDGKTIHPQWEKQLRQEKGTYGIIFHDYDLGAIEGAYDLINDNIDTFVSHKRGRRIGMKFPTQINTETDLLKWLKIPALNRSFFLQYNGILTTNNIETLKELRQNSSSERQTLINITKNTNYEQFISTDITNLFKNMLDLRREQLGFPLIYDRDFFIEKRWEEVVRLICKFNNHILANINNKDYYKRIAPYESFYSYVNALTKEDIIFGSIYPKEKAIELFQFVREQNYELFVLFYEYTGEKLL